MDNNRVLRDAPKPWDGLFWPSVGEHSSGGEWSPRGSPGASGKADVGISNDKGGGIPPRRKTKGSRATSFAPG